MDMFKRLLSEIFCCKEELVLDSIVNFLRICSNFRENLSEKEKEYLYQTFISFTSKNKFLEQEKINFTPFNTEISDINQAIKESNKIFYSMQYLNSEERQFFLKNLIPFITKEENPTEHSFNFLKKQLFLSKENKEKQIFELKEQVSQLEVKNEQESKEIKEEIEKINAEEEEIVKQFNLLNMKLEKLKQNKKKLNEKLEECSPSKLKEKSNAISEKIENLVKSIEKDSQNVKELYQFMTEICKPNLEFISQNIYSEEKKRELEENLKFSIISIIQYLKPLIAQKLEDKEENPSSSKNLKETENLFELANHIVMINEITQISDEKLIETVKSFEKFINSSTGNLTETDIEDDEEEEEIVENLEEDDELTSPSTDTSRRTSMQMGKTNPNRSPTQMRATMKISMPINFTTLKKSILFQPEESIPKSARKRTFLWKPPTIIPDSESLMNKTLSKNEKIMLLNVKEELSNSLTNSSSLNFFTEEILLRMLRKTLFKPHFTLKSLDCYQTWYHSYQLPFQEIDFSQISDFISQQIIYPTQT